MVEYTLNLDAVFGCLADPTRRDILRRVAGENLSVNDIAKPYSLSLAAVSKHLKILEKARLIVKNRRGRQQFIQLAPAALKDASTYLQYYQNFLEANLDSLENYLKKQ